jgi:hypothetical protein
MATPQPPSPPMGTGAPAPPPPPSPGGAPLPWEQPGYPFLEALYETAKLILTRPSEAFARMSVAGDLGRPLGYAVIFGWVGIIASQLYSLAFRGVMWSFLPGMPRGREMLIGPALNVVVMVVAPVIVLLGVFVWSAIVHLVLLVAGEGKAGFGGTVRVICYAGTTQIFQVLPICGGLVCFVWGMVLEIIGLAHAHRTTQGKAALAVLLPIVVCCVCVAICIALFGAAIMAAISHAR